MKKAFSEVFFVPNILKSFTNGKKHIKFFEFDALQFFL